MTKLDTTGWYVTDDTPDPEFLDFVGELRQVIVSRIINQIQHHPDIKFHIGPYDMNARGSKRPVLFTVDMRGKQLEINIRDRQNVTNPHYQSAPGFAVLVSGDGHVYTMKGLISYINDKWIPRQEANVRRAKNRQGAADELAEAISGFTSQKYDQNQLSPLIFSIVRRWSQVSDTELEYYIITDKVGETLLKLHSEDNHWSLRQQTGDLRFIWVALKKGQNMSQVGYFYSEASSSYSGVAYHSYHTIKSNWFSPKNLMPQLNKLAGKAPCLATLLADPRHNSDKQ